jgi:CRISPR/Cas system endoribonuclease Cas6 (RAMP superfamily)
VVRCDATQSRARIYDCGMATRNDAGFGLVVKFLI